MKKIIYKINLGFNLLQFEDWKCICCTKVSELIDMHFPIGEYDSEDFSLPYGNKGKISLIVDNKKDFPFLNFEIQLSTGKYVAKELNSFKQTYLFKLNNNVHEISLY